MKISISAANIISDAKSSIPAALNADTSLKISAVLALKNVSKNIIAISKNTLAPSKIRTDLSSIRLSFL